MTVTRLTPFQQGELAAFIALRDALILADDAGEEVDMQRVFELLDVLIAVLEGFDGGPVFEVVR